MSDLVVPDVSEFQGAINWRALVSGGYPAAIIRAHNGYRTDYQYAANRPAAHTGGIRALGIYQYLVAGRDAALQANELCNLVGTLKPGEWLICDLEEGSGDQSPRAHAWLTTVMSRLHDAGTAEELYSGDYFLGAHNLSAAGFKRVWVAAYGSSEPGTPHELWQFTDRRAFPGIASPCDASIYHGTIDQLLAHATPAKPPAPKPAPAPSPAPTPHYLEEEVLTYINIPAGVDVDIPVEPAGTVTAPQGGVRNGPIYFSATPQGKDASVQITWFQHGKWQKTTTFAVPVNGNKYTSGLPTDGSVSKIRVHSSEALLAYIVGRQVA